MHHWLDFPPFPHTSRFWLLNKKQLVNQFTRRLTVPQQQRFHSVARHTLQLSKCSHLLPEDKPVANLWQICNVQHHCSPSLCFMNLVIRHSLQPQPCYWIYLFHMRFIWEQHSEIIQQQTFGQTSFWANWHASDSRSSTHALFAQELTKIANSSGVPTTCVKSHLPYRDTDCKIRSDS